MAHPKDTNLLKDGKIECVPFCKNSWGASVHPIVVILILLPALAYGTWVKTCPNHSNLKKKTSPISGYPLNIISRRKTRKETGKRHRMLNRSKPCLLHRFAVIIIVNINVHSESQMTTIDNLCLSIKVIRASSYLEPSSVVEIQHQYGYGPAGRG
jgi:hypothetical protein